MMRWSRQAITQLCNLGYYLVPYHFSNYDLQYSVTDMQNLKLLELSTLTPILTGTQTD
jgi:hypothetical protein